MEREEAVSRLRNLIGRDLRKLAERHGVTVFTEAGTLNKGWAGHVLELYLGLSLNSAQSPDAGTWELKVVPLRRTPSGGWKPKETMAITMISPADVVAREFEVSHLYAKLRRLVVCGREYVDEDESRSMLVSVDTFDFDDHEDQELLAQIKRDYEEVRETIKSEGFDALSGRMGVLVQPRTKGPGHGSTSRAFYARTGLVARLLKLSQS